MKVESHIKTPPTPHRISLWSNTHSISEIGGKSQRGKLTGVRDCESDLHIDNWVCGQGESFFRFSCNSGVSVFADRSEISPRFQCFQFCCSYRIESFYCAEAPETVEGSGLDEYLNPHHRFSNSDRDFSDRTVRFRYSGVIDPSLPELSTRSNFGASLLYCLGSLETVGV